jgi:hypothetical protein
VLSRMIRELIFKLFTMLNMMLIPYAAAEVEI